ncbi:MAG: histidine kinase [Lachnospiraceae bacterium]|nr:histidine kinase [Lachnospiraceae bacterium]
MREKLVWTSSLSTKLILIVCSILIPVNVMLVILSQSLIRKVQNELLSSYEHELELYMTQIDDELTAIDSQLQEFMTENWANLTPSSSQYELTRYQVWSELKASRESLKMVHAAYIMTNENDWIAVTYDSEYISLEESDILKAYFSDADIVAYQSYHFDMIDIEGKKYLVDNANYYTYSFGMLTCADALLESIRETPAQEGEYFYLIDSDGQIVSDDVSFMIDTEASSQNLTIAGQEQEYRIICYPSSVMDYSLVRLIPSELFISEIPQLERVLQVLCVLSFLLIPLMLYAIHKLVLGPLHALDTGMHELEQEHWDFRLQEENSSREFRHMNHVFNDMTEQIHDLKIEAYERELEKLRIEATNLRLQINPHLLLNSLNMIYSLAQSKNYSVILRYTQSLVRYFRYSLRQTDELVPLRSEMGFVKDYLDIQNIRFPNAFTNVYEVDEELDDTLIPPLLIQNFVENSIKYALKMGETIEILILIKRVEDTMTISIIDTGNGIPEETLNILRKGEAPHDRVGTHIGIQNCRRRLALFYGDDATISINSTLGEGTQVWIQIPVRRQNTVPDSITSSAK